MRVLRNVVVACAGLSLAAACTPHGLADPAPIPSASASATASPSALATPSIKDSPSIIPPATAAIPDRAFFTPPANRTHDAPPKPAAGPVTIPKPCGASHPSDAQIGRQRGRHLTYWGVNTPADYIPDGTVDQTITVYRPGGAEAAMAEFRAAVQSCPTQKLSSGATQTWQMSPLDRGDDAILIETTWKRSPNASSDPPVPPPSLKFYAAVVRIGDVVTVLYATGWEDIDADLAVTRDYAKRAEVAIRQWR
jgi:hypothetical protein